MKIDMLIADFSHPLLWYFILYLVLPFDLLILVFLHIPLNECKYKLFQVILHYDKI